MPPSAADQANQRLVDRMVTEGALWSPPLIAAFRQTPRHCFLHHVFVFQQRQEEWREIVTRDPGPAELELLYADRALITRLGQGPGGTPVPISSSSQPSLMAEMLEDLQMILGQGVLEVGAGTGYNAALMAHVVGAGLVHSVDVDRVVLSEAAEHLAAFPERGVQLHHGDGRDGWPDQAPFDRLIVTAATPDLEPAWLAQLRQGGILVAPVVFAPGMAFVVRGVVDDAVFTGKLTRGAYFMPLRTETETPQEENKAVGHAGPWKAWPAPWAGWFGKHRPRLGWGNVLQAIAFYGWVRGLEVRTRSPTAGTSSFGVLLDGAVCWFDPEDWQVSGPEGQELGDALWQAWLRAGGPWPTDYRLTVTANSLGPTPHESYTRRGPRCQQRWELLESRERPGWR
jgi:protein-L-isoaspartate(D-aspartate) O-methyltransferase